MPVHQFGGYTATWQNADPVIVKSNASNAACFSLMVGWVLISCSMASGCKYFNRLR
jgi:hypothetical protein